MYFILSFVILAAASCVAKNENFETSTKDQNLITCQQENYYYAVNGKCDTYIECKEFKADERTCPDGLRFNPKAAWPDYPCGYPSEIPCQGQDSLMSSECPDDWEGFYVSPSASSSECSYFRMCSAGRSFEMECPTGLAFNHISGVCDWPGLVPTCNPDAYLGFKCPKDKNGEYSGFSNHRFEGDCYSFYSCANGLSRLLVCDFGTAFNPTSGQCESKNLVHCDTPDDKTL